MALTSREFQYLCIGCFLVTPACAIITSSGIIEINTAVDITCINQPYTGTHIWKFNTAEVLICGPSNCMANASNPTRFSFVNDTGSGVFVFTINPVTRLDDESIIGCHNGSVEDTLKLEVRDSDDNQRKKSYAWIIGVSVTAFVVVFGGLILCCCCCSCCPSKPDPPKKFKFNENVKNDEMPYVSWEPGFNGGCDQTFILRFEKILIKTHNQTHTARGKPMNYKENVHVKKNTNATAPELNKPIDEGHSEVLDLKSKKEFTIQSDNLTEIVKKVKGLDPSSQYEIKLYGNNKYGDSEVKTLLAETHDKPKSPKEFKFNQNISSDELPFVSWVPGNNGGCYQKFILHFKKQLPETEIKTLNQAEENTNTRDAEPKPVQGHSEILDVESNKKFAIPSHNVTTIIRMQIKGLEPLSQYEITVCGKNKYGESEVKTLHEKMHDKPSPPKEFKFNQNISSDTFPNVSWVPGNNGGCYQTFILQFEKQIPETGIKTHNQAEENIHHQEITNTTAAELNKPKTVEGHSEKLDVESYNIFVIPSHNVTTTICMQIKGLEPSSQYEIKLFGKNKYGESKVKTLHAKIIGKPDPPKKLKFNENINDDEMPYVSWEPGFNGGCDQTFILRFEKILIKTHSRRDTVRGKPMTIKKINFVEGHHEILDVESNNIFAITSPKEAKEILLHIKGHEPSSTYKIMLHSENVYGRSTELTLDANESTGFGLIPGHNI